MIPSGWQFPELCQVEIRVESKNYRLPGFSETPWRQQAEIIVKEKNVGEINIYYTKELPEEDEGPFLKQERRLLETIVDRLTNFILLRQNNEKLQKHPDKKEHKDPVEWQIVLNLLRHTDKSLFTNVSQRMLNQLCWNGISAAEKLRDEVAECGKDVLNAEASEDNKPHRKKVIDISEDRSKSIFKIAELHYTSEQIQTYLQNWIQDDKLNFMVHITDRNASFFDIINAIRRYAKIVSEGIEIGRASCRERV